MTPNRHRHLTVLDGWRGISILLVLAAHLLPLGPKSWQLNEMAGPMGMALFFILSGFLITTFLLADANIVSFIARRVLRIVPLAWLTLVIALPLSHAAAQVYLPNFFFYANLPPYHLAEVASHFWSLGVEMQFYAVVAVIVAALGARGLVLLPALCIAVTVARVVADARVDITTWYRIDEVLAGATLALVHAGKLGRGFDFIVAPAKTFRIGVCLALFAASCHPGSGPLTFLRPYFAAALVGSTLLDPPAPLAAWLESRVLRYLASISFALYVFHGVLASSWLGSGDRVVKYLKRPLLIAATFALAHVSTFHYERRWIDLGRRISYRSSQPPQ